MAKTITKKDVANYLNSVLGLTKLESKQLVELFVDEIKSSLNKGEEVKLSGFGNFIIHHKKERPGRNPKTGEDVVISARSVVSFKAGPKLKRKIELSEGQ
ncbi:MAG: integration host factor subunit alpha [Gammaproteobacteria bacterium]|nr:integration host factor subunit alpha [Gammaproteobacteria bacterium]|tara:strand:- start:341 stop:640 length:300 start_codon:yes stop_codon:yes gene_type:complete